MRKRLFFVAMAAIMVMGGPVPVAGDEAGAPPEFVGQLSGLGITGLADAPCDADGTSQVTSTDWRETAQGSWELGNTDSTATLSGFSPADGYQVGSIKMCGQLEYMPLAPYYPEPYQEGCRGWGGTGRIQFDPNSSQPETIWLRNIRWDSPAGGGPVLLIADGVAAPDAETAATMATNIVFRATMRSHSSRDNLCYQGTNFFVTYGPALLWGETLEPTL